MLNVGIIYLACRGLKYARILKISFCHYNIPLGGSGMWEIGLRFPVATDLIWLKKVVTAPLPNARQ